MKKTLFYAALVSMLCIGTSTLATDATLYFSPVESNYSVGQIVKVNVLVNTHGVSYDTVRADMNFLPGILEVQSVSLNPLFSHASPENGFSNLAGTLSYGAGIPGASTSPMNFATVTFSVKKEGSGRIALLGSSLILSAGENILTDTGGNATFTVAIPTVEQKPKQVVIEKKTSTTVTPAEKPTLKENNPLTQNPDQQPTSNPALAALDSSAIPIANAISEENRNKYLTFMWPLLFLAVAAPIGYMLYKRNQQKA